MDKIERLDLADCIQVLGGIPHAEVKQCMARAQIYTQHSITAPNGDQEGLPLSLLEASSMGLPIVSTRHSGIREVVIDRVSGYLVSEGDVAGMAARIVELCRSPGLWTQFGAAGRARTKERFSLQAKAQKSIELMTKIVESKTG